MKEFVQIKVKGVSLSRAESMKSVQTALATVHNDGRLATRSSGEFCSVQNFEEVNVICMTPTLGSLFLNDYFQGQNPFQPPGPDSLLNLGIATSTTGVYVTKRL